MSEGEICKGCGHQRVESDAGLLGVCPKCNMPYAWGSPDRAARPVERYVPPAPVADPKVRAPSRATPGAVEGGLLEAGVATAILVLGCFAPIVTAPIVGDMNYVGGGRRDGMFVIGLAFVGLLLAFTGRVRGLMITGGLAALIIVVGLVDLFRRVDEAKAEMTKGASGLFGGLVQAMAESVQIQWGWVPLLAGAALTIAVGAGLRFKR